jgi:hypothetical protein
MNNQPEKKGLLKGVYEYIRHLSDQSEYWKGQALAWGILIVVLVAGGVLFAIVALSSVYGGGNISYPAVGSPGHITFRHINHMTFQNGKYKDCRVCHDKLFAAQKYGTYVIRALKDSPPVKVRIGKETSTLYAPEGSSGAEPTLVTYEVQRACATCATGNCHDGKESFSRFECLKCHQTK